MAGLYALKGMESGKQVDLGWKSLQILELSNTIIAELSESTNSLKSSITKIPGNQIAFLQKIP